MTKWHYLTHLTFWTVPVLAMQWLIGWRTFLRNLPALLWPALLGTLFFSAADTFAVRDGLWRFDPAQIIGWYIGWLPVEEVCFFFLTGLLVTHSFVLLLPGHLRR